jgi:hypothetical protein
MNGWRELRMQCFAKRKKSESIPLESDVLILIIKNDFDSFVIDVQVNYQTSLYLRVQRPPSIHGSSYSKVVNSV